MIDPGSLRFLKHLRQLRTALLHSSLHPLHDPSVEHIGDRGFEIGKCIGHLRRDLRLVQQHLQHDIRKPDLIQRQCVGSRPSYKEQWYLEKRNAICMTCGRVSPLSAQPTFEDLAVDFEGTAASGAERFYRQTLDKLLLKLLESRLVHTVTLKQTECRKRNKKIAAAVYLYQADNDGEWGEIRFDFESSTAEIVKLADWDTVKSNVFAKAAIQYVRYLLRQASAKQVIVLYVK